VVGIISTLSARASVGFFVKSTIRSVIAIARGFIVSTFCLLDLCVDFFAQTPELVGHLFYQFDSDLVQEGAVDTQGSVEFMVDIFWDQSTTELPEHFGMCLVLLPHGQHCSALDSDGYSYLGLEPIIYCVGKQRKCMNAPKRRKVCLEKKSLKGGDACLLVSLIKQVNCKAHLLYCVQRHDCQANGLLLL
jgi:hypothetical protein